MPHDFSERESEVLDVKFDVLDKGFVRLVDYMGTDRRVVQSARVSYGEGTKTVREDAGLIDYLLRNQHSSPFEQVVFTFHMKLPIVVARQMIRHRTGRLNEISGRYSVMKNEAYVPTKDRVCKQSSDNKQGSGEKFDDITAMLATKDFKEESEAAFCCYQEYVDAGMARELARINLPLSTYTEWYWQFDLSNLMKFLYLRLDGHAQYEIRQYAQAMYEIAKTICPASMSSFENHMLNGAKVSGKEKDALKNLLDSSYDIASEKLRETLSEKEYKQFMAKFGLV
jgi:thymidylate synthase (FAD)